MTLPATCWAAKISLPHMNIINRILSRLGLKLVSLCDPHAITADDWAAREADYRRRLARAHSRTHAWKRRAL